MDEVLSFCLRVLIDPPLALQAAESVRAEGPMDRLDALAAAGRACRERAPQGPVPRPAAPQAARSLLGAPKRIAADPTAADPTAADPTAADPTALSVAVAEELAAACAQLAERHRETLALRELLGLTYAEIATVIRVEPAAVGSLLARARLRLRSTLRGPFPAADPGCEEIDRSLRALARRQDGEAMPAQESDWLLDHLGGCEQCSRAHAAMLEASVCYRAWPSSSPGADDDDAVIATPA
jgi:hypothetical protein